MLIVVSPAKSLDYESKLATKKRSEPRLLDRSRELVEVMAQKSPQQLSTLMSISASLGELNHERFQDWEAPFTPENSRPAVLAFNGDVYMGMEPQTFSERDFTHAQKTLRILSGLYGVLRPLDLMQPYRLEMGSRVATARGKDLYGFWGDSITDVLNADIEASPGGECSDQLGFKRVFWRCQHEAARSSPGQSSVFGLQEWCRAEDSEFLRQAGPWVDGRLDYPQSGEFCSGSDGV